MRIAVLAIAALVVFFAARAFFGPSTTVAPTPPPAPAVAQTPVPQPAPAGRSALPAPGAPPAGGSVVVPLAPPDAPRPPASIVAGSLPPPQPAPQHADPVKQGPDARVGMGSEPAQSRSDKPAAESPEREEGTLTLEGSFSYKLQDENGRPGARKRVAIAGTLDCRFGRGSLYYRDAAQRVEWQSSQFRFDANAVCFADRDDLERLVTRFNAAVEGTYSPLTTDAKSEALGDGDFALRFVSTDPAGTALPSVMFCFVVRGGAYGQYRLPQNATKPSSAPGCTFLDNFSIKRTK